MKKLFVCVMAMAFLLILAGKGMAENVPGGSNLVVAAESGGVPDVSVKSGNEKAKKHEHKDVPEGFGGWGGVAPMVVFPNSSAFSGLTHNLGIESFPNAMFMIGGMGFGQLGPYFRIGGGGWGGNMYTSGRVLGFKRSANINIGFGGVVLYGMYPLGDRFDVYVRALLGAGGFSATTKADNMPNNWEGSQGFFAFNPAIGVAFHPVKWMSVELEGGYFGMQLQKMRWNGSTVVKEGMNGGPTVQLNILFGGVSRKK